MFKFYRVVAGKNFYCNEKGILEKDADGLYKEVPAEEVGNLEEVSVEDEGTEEVEKMLKAVAAQVKTKAESALGDAQVKATEAVTKLFDSITESAKKGTKVAETAISKASFDVEKVKGGIKALAERQRNTFSFEVKSVRDLQFLLKTTSETDNVGDGVIEGDRDPEITRDPVRSVFVESISNRTPNMTSDHLSYVEVTDEDGAPLATAELGTIPQKDWTFAEFTAPLKKITVMNKHSVEILQDAPQLVNAIKGWLQEDINIEVDNQLLNGSGSGDNLTGVFGLASVLDATEIGAKRVEDANLYDVIRVAITKVAVYGKGKFNANYVLLNPEDADALDLTKDANGQYILPPFRSADGTLIKGARIIENVGVPEGEFLVGDFRKLHVGSKGGVEIEMTNSDGDDFSKDILSVKLRRRITSYVRANDNGAFWTGDISDVIDALTASAS